MLAGGLKRVDSSSALVTGARRAFTTCRAILLPNAPLAERPSGSFWKMPPAAPNRKNSMSPGTTASQPSRSMTSTIWLFAVGWNFTKISPTTPTRGLVPSPCKGSVSKSSTICLTVRLNSPRFTPRFSCRLHSAIQWSNRAFALPGSTS